MSFDIDHLHIDEASPEGQALLAVVRQEQVSPEEAIRHILRAAGREPLLSGKEKRGPKPPNLELAATDSVIGMFADRPELDVAIDSMVANRAERYTSRP